MHIDRPFLDEDMVAPYFVEQLGTRVNPFGVSHEEEQQAKLGRPQFDRLAAGQYPVGGRIERQVGHLDRFSGQVRRPAA